ncbi:MAG: metalloregulator ArsR/SmtB family transcription factor [Pseudomonadota bacterium]
MQNVDATFSAISDKTRRAILDRLREGDSALSEIAAPFNMSQTAVSKHVRILSEAGLLSIEKRGRTRYCSLNATPLKEASEWFENYQEFWSQQFDNLANFLMNEEEKE